MRSGDFLGMPGALGHKRNSRLISNQKRFQLISAPFAANHRNDRCPDLASGHRFLPVCADALFLFLPCPVLKIIVEEKAATNLRKSTKQTRKDMVMDLPAVAPPLR